MVVRACMVIQLVLRVHVSFITLIHALKRTGGKKGVAALCIGGEATADFTN